MSKLTVILTATAFLAGCSPMVTPATAGPSACRFPLIPRPKTVTLQVAKDFSSPPGAYETLPAAQKIGTSGHDVTWGSWFVNGPVEQRYIDAGQAAGWIQTPLPLTRSQRVQLKKLYPKGAILGVPFKDPNRVLIYQEGPSYSIADLQSGKILWRDQGRFEAPTIDFKTDLLHCHGDLEFTEYTFGSDGQPR
jgi:hypothetical protein